MIEKKYKNTRRADRNLIAALILVGVLCAMIVAAVFIIRSMTKEPDPTETLPPEIIEGEDTYLGAAIAYPRIESSGFSSISVWKKDGAGTDHKLSFAIQRGGMSVYKNSFYFSYTNSNGIIVDYEPPIADKDPYFDYNDLHAAAMASSAGSTAIPKITYITTALGALYFDQRIEVPADASKKEAFLNRYGIGDEATVVYIDGKNIDGTEVSYAVTIGDKTVTGSTYYFTVSDGKKVDGKWEYTERPYVYATKTNYFDYALVNFESFLHSTLVAAGLPQDSALEPIFTPGYSQWKNTVYKYRTDSDGNILGYYFEKNGAQTDTDRWRTEKDDRVLIDAIRITPYTTVPVGTDLEAYEKLGFTIGDDGYLKSPVQKVEIDLKDFALYDNNRYLTGALVGMEGGYVPSGTVLTQLSDFKDVIFVVSESETYSYKITAIESVFENGRELLVGTSADNEAVKITYDYYVSGSKINTVPLHAVIVLDESAEILDAATKNALASAEVGSTDISFDVTYTKGDDTTDANAIICTSRIVLRMITGVYDAAGKYLSKINEDCYVSYTYYIERSYSYGGQVIVTEKVAAEKPSIIHLADSSVSDEVREFFVGKQMDDYEEKNLTVAESKSFCQPMRDFNSFDVKSVSSTVRSEKVVSFAYSPDVDPFYRESLYENTLENEYGAYALNANACNTVLFIIGGLGENASTSEGLKGDKTVAVGITPDVMEKYGLYANTIRFVLPRGLYDGDIEGKYDRDVYAWQDELVFDLFISNETEDGKRYIASKMYDIVAEIDGADFRFLDSSFIDIWARRSIAMLDVNDIERMKISLDLDDYKGDYSFTFVHETASNANGEKKDVLHIFGIADKNKPYTENEFIKYALSKSASGSIGSYIDLVYENKTGEETPYGKEGAGVSNFKSFIRVMYNTQYCKDLTAQQQTEAMSKKMLLKISFDIEGNGNEYFLEFRRVDDSYVMVSIYTVDKDGNRFAEASDFCISNMAFKKLVDSFICVLDVKDVDADGYSGVSK